MNSSVTSVDSHIVDDDPEPTSPVIGIGNNWWSTMLLSNTQSQPSPSVTGSVPDLESSLNWSCSLPAGTTVCDIAGHLRKTMVNTSKTRADCHQQLGTPANAFTDSTLSATNNSLGGVAEHPVWGEQGCYLSCPGGEIMHGLQNCSVEGLQDLLYNTRALRHHGGEFLLSDELQKKMEEMPMWDQAPKNFTFQGDGMNMEILERPTPTLQYSQLVDDRSSSTTSTLSDVERWSAAQEHHHCISQTDSENVFTSCSEMPNAVQFNRSRVKQEYPGSYGHSTSPCTTSPYWNPVQGRYFAAEAYNNSNRNCSQVVIDQSGNQPLFKTDPNLFEEHRPPQTAHAKLHAALLQQRFRPCQSSSPSAQMLAFGNSLRRSFSDITPFRPEMRQAESHGTATSDRGFSLQYMQHPFEGKPLQGSVEIIRETPSDPKRIAGSMATCEAASDGYLKRPRVEPTPSLPFKQVRKEKLGDRITTLQQLVSPFGKTDTASVLLEAIQYIKFLQGHVQALSMPYMKSSCTSAHQNEPGKKSWLGDKSEHTDEPKQDLRSKGLCLVPLSCTIHVASDNGADYWTPACGVAFR